MKYWIKIDRLMAWVLFATMLTYLISGYGMTKGLIDSSLARTIHNQVLTYIMLVTFVFHSAFAIRLALMRWKIWNTYGKWLWIIFYALFIFGFIYIDKFYQKPSLSFGSENSKVTQTANSGSDNSSPIATSIKTFTASELSKYNGQNGNPAYVAVDGDVYDLSSVFQDGKHFSHYAGTELTNVFYTYHAKSVLAKYPIVGSFVK